FWLQHMEALGCVSPTFMACCVLLPMAPLLAAPPDSFSPTGSSELSDMETIGPPQSTTAFREWKHEGSPAGDAAETVPGLFSLLSSVGLSSYEVAAEAWCNQMGAAHLAELAEDEATLKSFGEALGSKGGLSDAAQRRLSNALKEAAGGHFRPSPRTVACKLRSNQSASSARLDARQRGEIQTW
ncbi:unnamed protein product, partial [Effrenium voratum]